MLSGLATGDLWICYFRALKIGQAAQVAPIDKLSVVLVAIFGVVFLGERLTAPNWLAVALIAAGAVRWRTAEAGCAPQSWWRIGSDHASIIAPRAMKRNENRFLSAAQVNLLSGAGDRVAAGVALIVVSVNGQCSPLISEIGVTCATKFSQRLADFGFSIAMVHAWTPAIPIVLAVGGLIFFLRDARQARLSRAPS